ncbi:hypothetical protein [Actinacidiphila acididurans]|uniref:Uncharacterized protein n=1 Tax=Actinacidiphila acididurans TaxID=2784346 RepID=A0ABS2U4V0_9ACTN|nr:hypothetical protein [Actinacidiphila acididurans]MBM9510022.1 hypothetical protein [Actinacidiphila acididurans]
MLYLYPIVCAALAAAWAAASWRCITYRRTLLRERAEARLAEACWARDVTALEDQARAVRVRAGREAAVLAQAAAVVVDAALATAGHGGHRSDPPLGGTDG